MSRTEYKQYNRLNQLLKFAYHISDREIRVRAIANIQTKMAELMQ